MPAWVLPMSRNSASRLADVFGPDAVLTQHQTPRRCQSSLAAAVTYSRHYGNLREQHSKKNSLADPRVGLRSSSEYFADT